MPDHQRPSHLTDSAVRPLLDRRKAFAFFVRREGRLLVRKVKAERPGMTDEELIATLHAMKLPMR